MKTLYEILNKKNDQKLKNAKTYKKKWKTICEHMEQCGISVKDDTDADCFTYEIIEKSLQIKERFEEVFLDVYVSMHDYWYDLTYQERKKQMNVDIEQLKEKLVCFSYEGQDIYMPCFSSKFNHLYTDEIVLLDLKQYHKFIRNFAEQICKETYGVLPYANGFTSAHVLTYNEEGFVLYHEDTNRLYLYQGSTFMQALSLDPKRKVSDSEELYTLAQYMLCEDEDALAAALIKSDLLSSRMHKKIERYQRKKEKKESKRKKKEHKQE